VCDLEKQKPHERGGQAPLGGYYAKKEKKCLVVFELFIYSRNLGLIGSS